jgi:hypothetical protein
MTDVLRHELKFCCLEPELTAIYEWLYRSPSFIKKQYPDRYVNNIYFDNFNLQDASDNLVGLASREKLRLRWYGAENTSDNFRLERKIKKGLVGYKKCRPVEPLPLKGVSKRRLYEHLSTQDGVHRPVDMRLRNPVLRNRYLREYYVNHSGHIRITVDTRQAFFSLDRADSLLCGHRIDYPVVVVEVKFDEEKAAAARNVLKGFPLRPHRHSKYLAGLARLIEHPYY